MTAKRRDAVCCPSCGCWHTNEDAFRRWIRNEPTLDSRKHGFVTFDCDQIIHRYMFHEDRSGSRDIQAMMLIEVKCFNAKMGASQHDTLKLFSQVLQNRSNTPTQEKHSASAMNRAAPAKAFSEVLGKWITLHLFGAHLLTLSGADPTDSKDITWDYKQITLPILLQILRFELHPEHLTELNLRRHHEPPPTPLLDGLPDDE